MNKEKEIRFSAEIKITPEVIKAYMCKFEHLEVNRLAVNADSIEILKEKGYNVVARNSNWQSIFLADKKTIEPAFQAATIAPVPEPEAQCVEPVESFDEEEGSTDSDEPVKKRRGRKKKDQDISSSSET